MATLTVFDTGNQKKEEMELDDRVFAARVNPSLIHEVIRADRASLRKGTAATKNRTLVRGGGAKPWKQKGTGRARAGSRRSPLWRGGGTIFGPMPRDYGFSMPKKAKRQALRAALSLKREEGKLIILDDFPMERFKTQDVQDVLTRLQVTDALIVTEEKRPFLERSARNLPKVRVLRYEGLNPYEILNHEHLILLAPVIQRIQEVLAS
jgi:large subunit ribosomal protein L4